MEIECEFTEDRHTLECGKSCVDTPECVGRDRHRVECGKRCVATSKRVGREETKSSMREKLCGYVRECR